MGNAVTVIQMLRASGRNARAISNPQEVDQVDKLIVPGVGAWDRAADALWSSGWSHAIQEFATSGRPILGICLGFQLLFDSSAEGNLPGLSLLKGKVLKLNDSLGTLTTNVGWLEVSRSGSLPTEDEHFPRYYFSHQFFVHSRYLEGEELTVVRSQPEITAALRIGNVFGAQFHPERSLRYGSSFLSAFAGDPK